MTSHTGAREIKFRAWNKEKSVMVYNDEDDSSDYWDGAVASEISMVNQILSNWKMEPEYSWMQFTGLKDKNGTEIYEGDILKWRYYSDHGQWGEFREGPPHIVEFSKGKFSIAVLLDHRHWDSDLDNIEVIGNIHENPELAGKP